MHDIEALYDRYFRDVYLYCRALSGDAHTAEDLTSETFEKALLHIGSFRGDCDVRVWLCQIAKHAYLSLCRKSGRLLPDDALAEKADPYDMEQAVLDADTAARIRQALDALPEPYRAVFRLRVYGGLPFRKIGEVFGKSENWACVTFHRAKKSLTERIQGDASL